MFGCVLVTHSTCSYKCSTNEEVESLNQAWHEEMSVACVVCMFVYWCAGFEPLHTGLWPVFLGVGFAL